MPRKPAAATAAVQPKAPPTRCRIGIVCHGDADPSALRLRRVRSDGVVRPTLCCEACAEHVTQPAEATA